MKQKEQDSWHQNIKKLSKVTNLTMLYEPQATLKSNRLFYRMGTMIFPFLFTQLFREKQELK